MTFQYYFALQECHKPPIEGSLNVDGHKIKVGKVNLKQKGEKREIFSQSWMVTQEACSLVFKKRKNNNK